MWCRRRIRSNPYRSEYIDGMKEERMSFLHSTWKETIAEKEIRPLSLLHHIEDQLEKHTDDDNIVTSGRWSISSCTGFVYGSLHCEEEWRDCEHLKSTNSFVWIKFSKYLSNDGDEVTSFSSFRALTLSPCWRRTATSCCAKRKPNPVGGWTKNERSTAGRITWKLRSIRNDWERNLLFLSYFTWQDFQRGKIV